MTYGTDISTFPDLDPTFTPISGARVLAEAVARRWLTAAGGLHYDASYGGVDIRTLLNAGLSPSDLGSLAGILRAQAEEDERVAIVEVTVTFRQSDRTLVVSGVGTGLEGETFGLTLSVDALSTALQIDGNTN